MRLSHHLRQFMASAMLVSAIALATLAGGDQPAAGARTIALTSAKAEQILSRMLPLLDRADQRQLRLQVTANRSADSNAPLSYLDPSYHRGHDRTI